METSLYTMTRFFPLHNHYKIKGEPIASTNKAEVEVAAEGKAAEEDEVPTIENEAVVMETSLFTMTRFLAMRVEGLATLEDRCASDVKKLDT